MNKKSICGLNSDEIFAGISPSGFTVSNALSIANAIYKKRKRNISQIEKIPRELKNKLDSEYCTGIFDPVFESVSNDGTVKYLFKTESGLAFETVYIPDTKRGTVCVSTQSGCRMGCPFCATAAYGFRGNLSAGEIVNQIISIPFAHNITHIVFMGMGEPMDNLDNVLKACEIITAEWGLSISPRNITVSTVGILQGIKKYLNGSECNLTLSLFSPFPEERQSTIPAEKNNPANDIILLMKNYPVRKQRRLSIAYVMINELNDSDRHLEGLKLLLKGSKIRINLLNFHPVENNQNIQSTAERMQFFKHNLVISGISASIRRSRGVDISAACGLLARDLTIETGIHQDTRRKFLSSPF
jgi:23S rRNA (adenine2503-C2)-methyltransferase